MTLLLTAFGLWAFTSAVLHIAALEILPAESYFSMVDRSITYGMGAARHAAMQYMMIPLIWLTVLYIIYHENNTPKLLGAVSFCFVPSLTIGLIQGLAAPDLLKHAGKPISGLSIDYSGFGMSLFLVIPLCLSFLLARRTRPGLRTLVPCALFIIAVLTAHILRIQKTSLLGLLFFASLLPAAYAWANGRSTRRVIIRRAGVCLLIPGLIAALWITQKHLLASDLDFCSQPGIIEKTIDSLDFDHGRLRHWKNAAYLTVRAPLGGWGPGGFYREENNEIFRRTGERSYVMDNAGNLYLQLAADLGIPGALLLTAVHILPLVLLWRQRIILSDIARRRAVAVLGSTLILWLGMCLAGPHLFSPDVLLLSGLLITGLYVLIPKKPKVGFPLAGTILLFVFITSALSGYSRSFGDYGYAHRAEAAFWPRYYETGLMKRLNRDDLELRVINGTAVIRRPATSDYFSFLLTTIAAGKGEDRATVRIIINGHELPSVAVAPDEPRAMNIHVPGLTGKMLDLSLKVSSYSDRPSTAVSQLQFLSIPPVQAETIKIE